MFDPGQEVSIFSSISSSLFCFVFFFQDKQTLNSLKLEVFEYLRFVLILLYVVTMNKKIEKLSSRF